MNEYAALIVGAAGSVAGAWLGTVRQLARFRAERVIARRSDWYEKEVQLFGEAGAILRRTVAATEAHDGIAAKALAAELATLAERFRIAVPEALIYVDADSPLFALLQVSAWSMDAIAHVYATGLPSTVLDEVRGAISDMNAAAMAFSVQLRISLQGASTPAALGSVLKELQASPEDAIRRMRERAGLPVPSLVQPL